jgi:hypothetical protein
MEEEEKKEAAVNKNIQQTRQEEILSSTQSDIELLNSARPWTD